MGNRRGVERGAVFEKGGVCVCVCSGGLNNLSKRGDRRELI